MAEDVVRQLKLYIQVGNLECCQEYIQYIRDEYEQVPWDYVYQKAYLHACLCKQTHIVDWLLEVYNELSPIEQIAIRQVFPYGRYLLAKPSLPRDSTRFPNGS